jgi:hypothetical protein
MDKRLVTRTLGGAEAAGIVLGAAPSIFAGAADFKRGLAGEASADTQLRAEAATPALQKPLSAEEQQDLMQGLLYVVKDEYADAARVLGKYAMRGDPNAQTQIGALYYFGKGLPLDRDEGIRWLRLASAQGSGFGQEALSAATSGTWAWESSGSTSAPEFAASSGAMDGVGSPAPQYGGSYSAVPYGSTDMGAPDRRMSYSDLPSQQFGYDDPRPSSLVGDLSAQSTTSSSNTGAINVRSGQYMAPAGPGGYVDPRNGTVYAPSGPDGVVNTRTGEYSPVSH